MYSDWALTAAELGTPVSATAVEKRLAEPLVNHLKQAVQRALMQVVANDPAAIELVQNFTAVKIGDSTTI